MLLPADKARHVGEAVAMVVAETPAQALDAAEAVEVDYEELPCVYHSEDAMKPGAPAVWDEVPDNILVDTFVRRPRGDRPGLRRRRSCRRDGLPHRPRDRRADGAARRARPLRRADRPLHALCRQRRRGAAEARACRACSASRRTSLRVLSYDVGGNFGTRNRVFVEFGLVLWAARKLGRPVKFTATRSEAFLTDYQGRDLVTKVELALRKDGRFLAMRATNISNVGARCVSLSPLSKGAGLIPGSYDIPGRDAARDGGLHQHHADPGLSQLRPAGGDLRDRAADRHRRAPSSASIASRCGART